MKEERDHEIWDVAVIGAGASGLMAATAAAQQNASTLLLERNRAVGRKIALAGGGRCNFTNTLPPRQFLRAFGDKRASRLGHALRALGPEDVVALLERQGVRGRVEQGTRLFTASGRGRDVAEALCREAVAAGATLRTDARVREVAAGPDGWRVTLPSGLLAARAVVVCTGGITWPKTGSSGDGFAWAQALEHRVTPLRAALVGLLTAETWPQTLAGTAVQAVAGGLFRPEGGRKALASERQDLLFTHFGLSGPLILDLSNAYVDSGLAEAELRFDFLPDTAHETLDRDLQQRWAAAPRRSAVRALEGLLPTRLLSALGEQIHGAAPCVAGQVTRRQRRGWVEALKSTRLTVTGTRGSEHGEVTAGGVDWDEIDPATLMSRHHAGLFFAGELLDVAGRCGGFNLQAAFASGFLAGRSAAHWVRG